MEPITIPAATKPPVLSPALADNPTWLNVDLRFVIAAVVVFGAVIATTIRFSHELFDPLADSLMLQGWAAVVARPSLLWFSMGMLLLVGDPDPALGALPSLGCRGLWAGSEDVRHYSGL